MPLYLIILFPLIGFLINGLVGAKLKKPIPGVIYRHPKTGDEWTAPANLRRVKKWLQDLVGSSGKRYEDFAAKR